MDASKVLMGSVVYRRQSIPCKSGQPLGQSVSRTYRLSMLFVFPLPFCWPICSLVSIDGPSAALQCRIAPRLTRCMCRVRTGGLLCLE